MGREGEAEGETSGVIIDRTQFFKEVRSRLYRGIGLTQPQVDGLNFLLERFEADPRFEDRRWIAYAFATIKVECDDTWEPIVEKGPKSYFKRYDWREDLGHHGEKGIGFLYRGRGYSMCTGLRNYTLFSNKLGIDLVKNPDLATDRQVAYQILSCGMTEGLFTSRKLAHYFNDQKAMWEEARRIINGKDRAAEIAGYGRSFALALAA